MQLIIKHNIPDQLVLPINYHHIIQSMIYRNLENSHGYSAYLHNEGYSAGERSFKLFTFGLLQGKYEICEKKIIFRQSVRLEIRSVDSFMLKTLAENIRQQGLSYGEQHFDDIELRLSDVTVEQEEIKIKMVSPVSVYSTDIETGKTYFYAPEEEEFRKQISANFMRKYEACYGVKPTAGIQIEPVRVTPKDRYVTRYKSFYISGWWGEYVLSGERKYLDFLYQTGLGSKNAQGFGMFKVI